MTEDVIEETLVEVVEETAFSIEVEVESVTELVKELVDGLVESVEDFAEVVIDEETVIIETLDEKGEQGPPGAGGISAQTARDIAEAETEELRVDFDALVAATLFQ